VGPADFIALAEETGLIVPIGTGSCKRRAATRAGGRRSDATPRP